MEKETEYSDRNNQFSSEPRTRTKGQDGRRCLSARVAISMILPEKDKWNSDGDLVQYDPGFVAYLGFIFDPTRPCVDVGANVGKVSRFLAARTKCDITSF